MIDKEVTLDLQTITRVRRGDNRRHDITGSAVDDSGGGGGGGGRAADQSVVLVEELLVVLLVWGMLGISNVIGKECRI